MTADASRDPHLTTHGHPSPPPRASGGHVHLTDAGRRRGLGRRAGALGLVAVVVAAACAGGNTTTPTSAVGSPEATAASPPNPAGRRTTTSTSSTTVAPAPVVGRDIGAVAGGDGTVRWIRVPSDECTNVTATPVVVDDWLVWPAHHRRECREQVDPGARVLYGHRLGTDTVVALVDGAEGEAPLTWDADGRRLWWPVTFGGNVLMIDPDTFEVIGRVELGATSDSSGALLGGSLYVGTVNSPDPPCQEPINDRCGMLARIDASGRVTATRGYDEGFRAWIGTGATTDGTTVWWGSAAQTVGDKSGDEPAYLYGCSVIRTDPDLEILAAFDPGDPGCFELPFEGANMDSVSGEVVPDGDGAWVQYVRPNGPGDVTAVYRLDSDLNERCRLELPFAPAYQAVGFYGAPTVDGRGRAWVSVTVPGDGVPVGELWRLTTDCSAVRIASVPGSWAQASPTIAGDVVLFATDGTLRAVSLDGEPVASWELGSDARVLAGPVVVDGTVAVVSEDGTLTVIDDAPVDGYGDAIWPRYRHDNAGTGSLTGP